jgi:hypothetical protein
LIHHARKNLVGGGAEIGGGIEEMKITRLLPEFNPRWGDILK